MKLKSHVALFVFTISLLAVLRGWTDFSWESWAPATCMPSACFCEGLRDSLIRQPANTWSSLAFVLIGFWILWRARKDVAGGASLQNPITRQFLYGAIFGASLVIIGLGSAFYHASLTLGGQFIDVMGMYLLASFMLIYNITRTCRLKPAVMSLAYFSLVVSLAFTLLRFPEARRYVFAIMILTVLVLEYFARRRSKSKIRTSYIYGALATLVLAFAIWVLDITKIACNPQSWLQGHAVWHFLGALATLQLYLYYRSESIPVAGLDRPT